MLLKGVLIYISYLLICLFNIAGNGYVYGKLRVCVRGFSEGKSDVTNVQQPFDLAKNSNFLYTVL